MITSKVHVSLIIASCSVKLKLCQSAARIPEFERFMNYGGRGICIIQNDVLYKGVLPSKGNGMDCSLLH